MFVVDYKDQADCTIFIIAKKLHTANHLLFIKTLQDNKNEKIDTRLFITTLHCIMKETEKKRTSNGIPRNGKTSEYFHYAE